MATAVLNGVIVVLRVLVEYLLKWRRQGHYVAYAKHVLRYQLKALHDSRLAL